MSALHVVLENFILSLPIPVLILRRLRRVSNRKSPWITNDLRRQVFGGDYLKKKAVSINDPEAWGQYRQARNQINNAIKKAKRTYFTENLDLHRGDMKKTN